MDFNTISQALGNKYYRYIDDELELIRIIGLAGSDSVKIKYLRSGNPEKINTTETMKMIDILDKYRYLLSDGFISFNTVEIVVAEDGKRCIDDVMVLFWKRDKGKAAGLPNVICRQNINDFFYANFQKNENDMYVGVSCTQEDCPAEINFMSLLGCSKQNSTVNFNVYLDDNFEDILQYIKTTKFDHILEANLQDHLKCLSKQNGVTVKLKPGVKSVNGFCIDLETLLNENEFWYDVYQQMNITPVNFKLELNDKDQMSDPNQVQILRNIFKKNINETFVIKYDKDIDITKVRAKYVFIKDNTKTLYMVGFTEVGEYIEPDKRNKEIADEVYEALQKIAFRYSGKYN